MKKLLILICMVLGLNASAQTFYNPEDIEVTFMTTSVDNYWQSVYVVPTWSYSTINDKGVMCATWLIEGRFVTVYFGQDKTDMGICGPDGAKTMDEINNNVSLQLYYSSGKIEFDKVVYDPRVKSVKIPYGITSSFMGDQYSLLSVSLYKAINGGVTRIPQEEPGGSEAYYNLDGQQVDPEASTSQILIEKKGSKATKVINK